MTRPVTLVLPWPVSSNRYWRSYVPKGHRRAVVTLSDEAKAYKHQVGWIAKAAGIHSPFEGRVAIDVTLVPARPQDAARRIRRNPDHWDDDVRSIDLDNALKVTIDALKGIAFADDRWVWAITARRAEPDGEARMVVAVTPLSGHSPQQAVL